MLETQYSFYVWLISTVVSGLLMGYSFITLLVLNNNEIYRYFKENKSWHFILHSNEVREVHHTQTMLKWHAVLYFFTVMVIGVILYSMQNKGLLLAFTTLILFYSVFFIAGLGAIKFYKIKNILT